MSEYEYDREFWGEIDKATLKGLKRCATVMFYTMIGVVVTLLLQPVRLYQYLRYRWYNREEALIMLDFAEILASHGSACASGSLDPSPVLLAMGKSVEEASSSLRFTLGYENTKTEIAETIKVLLNLA